MSQFWKYTLIISGANLLVILICLVDTDLFLLWFLGLLIQFLIGIGLLIAKSTRTLGQAFLLSFAIVFAIGFSVCSMTWDSTNFH